MTEYVWSAGQDTRKVEVAGLGQVCQTNNKKPGSRPNIRSGTTEDLKCSGFFMNFLVPDMTSTESAVAPGVERSSQNKGDRGQAHGAHTSTGPHKSR